jgi:ankyrin repeat protein
VQLLLDHGADPNSAFTWGDSVHHSAEMNHRECLELLLAYGADLSQSAPRWKKTILYFLAQVGARPEGVEWQLENGADPNVPSGDLTERPLHQAAARGNFALTDLLVRHGADPNLPRADGRTSYGLAVRSGNRQVMEALAAAGARTEPP